MAGQMSDLMIKILANNATRPGFDAAARDAEAMAGRVQAAGARAASGMKTTGANVGILASQFNDIGVQLAGGQSPLLIALQQGTQITQAFGTAGASGAVSMLGSAFMSMLSPVNLITIAAIAGGGALVQYLTSLLSTADDSEEALKRQADLINNVAKQWGDALPAIKEYADAQARLKEQSDRDQATELTIGKTWENTKAQIDDMIVSMADLKMMISDAGETEALREINDAFNALDEKIKTNSASVDDLKRVQDALSAAYATTGIESIDLMIGRLGQLIGAINLAAERTAALNAQNINSKIQSMLSPLGGGLMANGEFTTPFSLEPNADQVQTEKANATKSQYQLELEKLAKGHSAAKTEAEKHAEAVKNVMAALDAEQQQLGMTATEQRVMNELRKAGASYLSEEGLAIAAKVQALEEEKAAQKATNEMLALQKDIANGTLTDIRSALDDGKITWKEWGDVAGNVIDKVANKAQEDLVDAFFDMNSSSSSGGLFSGLLGLFGLGGGTTSTGGGLASGLGTAKLATTTNALAGGNGSIDVRVSVDDEGALRAYVDKENRQTRATLARAAKIDDQNNFARKVRKAITDPRRIG